MKKLIAAAVAAAVIAPASVMAAGPTLYGKIHAVVSYNDNNASGNTPEYKEWSMSDRSSRIGVKGSEDLGNGMKVGYLIEWALAIDGTGGDMGQRNRAVTLSGDWGTALFGRWDTPYKTLGRKVDLFGDSLGDFRNINGDHDLRLDNVAAYVTPNMNGFSASVAYSFDAGEGNTCTPTVVTDSGGNTHTRACTGDNVNDDGAVGESTDNSGVSFNAIYNNGPIMAGVGYILASQNDIAKGANGESDQSSWRAAGSYAFGDFKVLASYTDFDSVGFVDKNDPSVWTLGGSYKMGNNTIKLQYADRDESGIKAGGSSVKDGSKMWALGLDHAMSKRTNVYVTYASVDNDDASARNPWGAATTNNNNGAAVLGEDADTFGVGIIHKF